MSDAHDGAAWAHWGDGRVGHRWDEVPFLWSESYFYRRLLAAVDFFSPGPWFWLLSAGRAREVAIHVKPVPYYVSDATTGDVAACLRRLASAGGHAADAARRLHQAFGDGRVRLRTSWFYVAPLEFDAMPTALAAEFGRATLTLMKGDLNYRRVFGDRHWTPTTDPSLAGSVIPRFHDHNRIVGSAP